MFVSIRMTREACKAKSCHPREHLQLLDTNAVGVRREKMYRIDDHMACAIAGLTGVPP